MSSWRPRPCFADSVALVAAGGLSLAVATPVGLELGVVTPPSDLEALDRVTATLSVKEIPAAPQQGSWVQFVHVAPPALAPIQDASRPEPIPAKGSLRLLPRMKSPQDPPPTAAGPTGSTVFATPFGSSRLSLHRADKRSHPRYRASQSALQRLTQRPTVTLPEGPRSADEHPIVSVPLRPGRESWQASRDLILKGHLPHPDLVRTESFVAAATAGGVAPHASEDPLAIHTDIAVDDVDAHSIVIQVTATTPPVRRDHRSPLELVLVVDTSGSMSVSGGLDEVRSAVLQTVQLLGPHDRVSLLAFDGEPKVLLPPTRHVDVEALATQLEQLQPDGATNAASGVRLALQQLRRRPFTRATRHVVMFSDGDLMATGRDEWIRAAAEVHERSATLHTFAIGQAWAESGDLEAQMAQLGAQHHAVADGVEAVEGLKRVLGSDAASPAQGVTLAVHFDPRVVDTYDLIGWHGSGPGRLDVDVDVPRVDLPAGSHSAVLFRVRLHSKADAGQSLGQVRVGRDGQDRPLHRPLRVPDEGAPPLTAQPDLAMADAAADLAEALRHADAAALDASVRSLHQRARPGRPEDAVLLRIARRSANLARLPVLTAGTNDTLDARLADLLHTLGEECFADLSDRRGDRHGQITARARFHHGRFAGAVILNDKIDDRMLEACIIQRLRTWAPPSGLEGDLVLPLVWGPTSTDRRKGVDEG